MEIELPTEKVDEQFAFFQEEYRKKARIDGFRPGKAPLEVVKTKYRDAIAKEVLDALISHAFQEAIKEAKLSPISVPIIKNLDFDQGKPLKIKAEVEIMPEFDLKDYRGIKLVRKTKEITDKDVERALESLRQKNAQLRAVEREARNGDFLVLDLERKLLADSRSKPEKFLNQLIELGSGNMLKEFQNNLQNTKAKDVRELELTYPEDYFEKNLAGKKAAFKIEVKEVKEKILPELNDEFAKSLGDYQDINVLKQRLKDDLLKRAKDSSEAKLRSDLIEKAVEANCFDVPESMLENYLSSMVNQLKRQYGKIDEQKAREQYKRAGMDRIRWNLIYNRLTEKEKISVEPKEIEEWTQRFARSYNLEVDKAKEILARNRELENIKDTILEEKILNYLLEEAEIMEEKEKPTQGED